MLWQELLTNKEPLTMLKKLTGAQRAAYDENGYVDKIDIFTDKEIE